MVFEAEEASITPVGVDVKLKNMARVPDIARCCELAASRLANENTEGSTRVELTRPPLQLAEQQVAKLNDKRGRTRAAVEEAASYDTGSHAEDPAYHERYDLSALPNKLRLHIMR